MDTLRFTFASIAVFALAFVGMAWMQRGMPVAAVKVEPLKPSPGIPTFEESVKQGARKDWEVSKTAQSDGDKARDQLRLELMQAAIGYKLSPCDATMKKNLVTAVTNYTSAWQAMAGCKFGLCNGNGAQIDQAAAAFQTPADKRVHHELRAAFEQGGIGKEDFPNAIRSNVFMWTGLPFGGGEQAACITQRAESRR